MIQFNLLPDVKLEYIKAQRMRRLVISVAVLVTVAAIVLFVLTFGVSQLQKKHLNDLDRDVSSEIKKLQSTPQLNRILTVQNQLSALSTLHNQKPAASQLLGYLNQVTPNVISISNLNVDMGAHTMTITGGADTLSSINQYVDTLKFTKYTVKGDKTQTAAFSSVVLSSFGLNQDNSSGSNNSAAATYTIQFSYDPNIFDITKTVNLIVPQIITTRSQVDKPTDLFKASPVKPTTGTTTSATGGTR